MKIQAGGKPLSSWKMTKNQDENAPSHINSTFDKLYWKKGLKQNALDFMVYAGTPITLDEDFTILRKAARPSSESNNAQFVYGKSASGIYLLFGHCYKHSQNKVVKAGTPITYIAPKAYNGGFGVHLHIAGHLEDSAYKVRDIIYPKVDMNVEKTKVLKGEGISQVAKRVGFADYGSELRWTAIAALNDIGSWRTFNTSLYEGKEIIVRKVETPPTEPVEPKECVECKIKNKHIEDLIERNNKLEDALEIMNGNLKDEADKVKDLEDELTDTKKQCKIKTDTLNGEIDRLNEQITELKKQLKEERPNWLQSAIEWIKSTLKDIVERWKKADGGNGTP